MNRQDSRELVGLYVDAVALSLVATPSERNRTFNEAYAQGLRKSLEALGYTWSELEELRGLAQRMCDMNRQSYVNRRLEPQQDLLEAFDRREAEYQDQIAKAKALAGLERAA